jgi:hypothetical protein
MLSKQRFSSFPVAHIIEKTKRITEFTPTFASMYWSQGC